MTFAKAAKLSAYFHIIFHKIRKVGRILTNKGAKATSSIALLFSWKPKITFAKCTND
jgi:hypothetical protein